MRMLQVVHGLSGPKGVLLEMALGEVMLSSGKGGASGVRLIHEGRSPVRFVTLSLGVA